MRSNITTSIAIDISRLMRLDTANWGLSAIPNYLNIPNYQRNYTWEKKQVEELFDDFVNHAAFVESRVNEASSSRQNIIPKYYLGQVVLVVDGINLNLLDGQQRLTTLYILNSVLSFRYRHLKTLIDQNNSLTDTEKALWLADIDGTDRSPGYLTILKGLRFGTGNLSWLQIKYQNDKAHFNHVISDSFNPDSNLPEGLSKTHGIFKAFQYLNKKIDELFQNESALDRNDVDMIRSYISTYNKIYDYVAGEHAEFTATIIHKGREFEIFETLNDRGKELTAFDLTRNLMIHSAGAFTRNTNFLNLEDKTEELFDVKIKERCKKGNSSKYEKNANDFILYSWNIQSVNKTTKKKYMGDFISFSKKTPEEGGWNNSSRDTLNRDNFLWYSSFLDKTSSYFTEFLNPNKIKDNDNWSTLNQRKKLFNQITCFNYANFKQYIQIYIALRYINCEISEIQKWIELIEKIYFNGFILFENSPAKYEDIFHACANDIYKIGIKDEADDNIISYEQTSLDVIYERVKNQFCDTIDLQIDNDDSYEAYKENFHKKFNLFKSTDNSRIQYILRKINDNIDDGNELVFDDLTVEHIVPKSYSQNWGNINFKVINEENKKLSERDKNGNTIAQNYINRLGNHTLLTQPDNSSLRDSNFATKITEYYKDSNLKITSNGYHNERKWIAVTTFNKWNAESIDKRQKAMSHFAFEIWGV